MADESGIKIEITPELLDHLVEKYHYFEHEFRYKEDTKSGISPDIKNTSMVLAYRRSLKACLDLINMKARVEREQIRKNAIANDS